MNDDFVPASVDAAASAELGGVDAPTSAAEHTQLTELACLAHQVDHFELSPEARARGLDELLSNLDRRAPNRTRLRPIVNLWWAVPLAAAVLLAWLLPLSPERAPVAVHTDDLVGAQNALLTARLTGAPIPRDDLERAQANYREQLLASLERDR